MRFHVDFETFSEQKLTGPDAVGTFRYAQDETTELLIACWDIEDTQEETVWDYRRPISRLNSLKKLVESPHNEMVAHNVMFEWCIMTYVLGWDVKCKLDCTMAQCNAVSIPPSLEDAAEYLRVARKDPAGKKLIARFCKPQPKNHKVRRWDADNDPEGFENFVWYCVQDVRAERGVDAALPPLTDFEKEVLAADLRMNARGIPIDMPNVRKVAAFLADYREQIKASTDAPIMSATGFKKWLNERGCMVDNIQKDTLARAETTQDHGGEVHRAIEARLKIQQASVKKLDKMIACAVGDRVRGTLQVLGAQRTGRWAGRLIQPQNLTRGTHSQAEKEEFFDLIQSINDLKTLEAFYGSPSAIVSSALRGFIKAPKGKKFLIADYSAIEARVLAWLVGDEGLLKLFRQGIDVYRVLAAKIYGVPLDKVTDEQRRLGKTAILGLGYQMGADKFYSTCLDFGLSVERSLTDRAHRIWRAENVKTVRFWRKMENAVRITTRTGRKSELNGLVITRDEVGTHIRLPSGRTLTYPQMRYRDGGLEFWGLNQYTHKYGWIDTYGGKLTENVTQAIARDLMANSLLELEKEEFNPIFVVHDEGICEVSMDFGTVDMLSSIMCRIPSWAKGVPMDVGGFECTRYRKE